MNPLLHAKLLNTLTEYDAKESTKKGYNRYALALYCGALIKTIRYADNGCGLRDAIVTCFCGRLCDKLLSAVDLEKMTADECKFGLATKLPELDENE